MMDGLQDWLQRRLPPIPEAFRSHLTLPREVSVEEEGPRSLALAVTASAELQRALSLPPGERTAAFHLLAADALLTYACEAAVEEGGTEDAVEEGLVAILARVVSVPL